MATVVNVPRDTRLDEFSLGLNSYLTGVRESRLDKLQQELMDEIAKAPDEVTATALMADPRFTKVVTDQKRFATITTFLGNAQPGQRSLMGYDDSGNQVPFSVGVQEKIDARLWAERGLHVSASRAYYVNLDPSDNESVPERISGRHQNAGEASDAAREQFGDEFFTVMEGAEVGTAIALAASNTAQRRGKLADVLAQDRFDFVKNSPTTVFTNLIEDQRNGKITDEMFEQAWTKLTSILGRTPSDIANSTRDELIISGASVEAASQTAAFMIKKILEDERILTDSKAVANLVADVSAEFKTLMSASGMSLKSGGIDSYNFRSLSSRSREFKGLILDLALMAAAARGQSGRSLSDKDLDRFLDRVGADIADPAAFMLNISTLINGLQRDHNIMYVRLQGVPNPHPFTRIVLDQKQMNDQEKKEMTDQYGIEWPDGTTPIVRTNRLEGD